VSEAVLDVAKLPDLFIDRDVVESVPDAEFGGRGPAASPSWTVALRPSPAAVAVVQQIALPG
jgi:hypothetical protein